jgi:hypothetical protein
MRKRCCDELPPGRTAICHHRHLPHRSLPPHLPFRLSSKVIRPSTDLIAIAERSSGLTLLRDLNDQATNEGVAGVATDITVPSPPTIICQSAVTARDGHIALTSNKHAPYWGPRRARSRWQIPRLMLGPCEHPRKDDKGGDNGCNDYYVNGWHDILFRDDRIR